MYDENGTPPFAEDAALRPLSPYAETKLATEKMLAAEESPKFIILRYFNVGGCDNKQRAGNYKQKDTTLIKSALECAAGKRSHLCLFGDDYPTALSKNKNWLLHYNQTSVCEIMDELASAVNDSVRRWSYIWRRCELYLLCSNIKFGNVAKESDLICQALPDWIQAININNWTTHASFWRRLETIGLKN